MFEFARDRRGSRRALKIGASRADDGGSGHGSPALQAFRPGSFLRLRLH